MTLEEMLKDLPKACNYGSKKNSQGYIETWNGYKLHIDTVDNGIPVSAILSSASLHDSQVAIPLATMTAGRIQWLNCLTEVLLGHSILSNTFKIQNIVRA